MARPIPIGHQWVAQIYEKTVERQDPRRGFAARVSLATADRPRGNGVSEWRGNRSQAGSWFGGGESGRPHCAVMTGRSVAVDSELSFPLYQECETRMEDVMVVPRGGLRVRAALVSDQAFRASQIEEVTQLRKEHIRKLSLLFNGEGIEILKRRQGSGCRPRISSEEQTKSR